MIKDDLTLINYQMRPDLAKGTLSIPDMFRTLNEAGIAGLDPLDIPVSQGDDYVAAMEETGGSVYYFMAHVPFFTGRENRTDVLKQQLSLAKKLSAKHFMIIPYNYATDKDVLPGMVREDILDLAVEGFAEAMRLAEGTGIAITFETTPMEFTRMSGIEDCLYVLTRVPGLGLAYDTANIMSHGDDPVEGMRALRQYITHFHLKDATLHDPFPGDGYQELTADGKRYTNCVFGEGIIPVKAIYDEMVASGYTGKFAIEYVSPDGQKGGSTAEMHAKQIKLFTDAIWR